MTEPDQTPTLAERLRASSHLEWAGMLGCLLDEAAAEIDRLTAALSVAERERDEQSTDLNDRLADRLAELELADIALVDALDKAQKAEHRAEVAEAERDALREQLAQATKGLPAEMFCKHGWLKIHGCSACAQENWDAARKRSEEGGPLQDPRTTVSQPEKL